MKVGPFYIYVEKFAGVITWYMTESKDFISSIYFGLKKGNNHVVSFNGKSISFRLSNKEEMVT